MPDCRDKTPDGRIWLVGLKGGEPVMNKPNRQEVENPIAVDIEKLSAMLSCGRATARKIGAEAGAEIRINRRVLFNVEKIREYINKISV